MNKRDAYAYALRCVADLAETSIGGGFEPTGNEEDDERVFVAMRQICKQLESRADAMERRRSVRKPPPVEYR